MKIVISSGHGKYVRGASGYLDEVNEARKVVEKVAEYWRGAGVGVQTFHDDTSTSQNQNLSTIVSFHNRQTRDYDVSVHFNAYQTTSKAMGTEVLYVTQSKLAADTSAAIAAAGTFINRGAKYRSDLYFLNNTAKPAILLEVCFVDSSTDANLYRANFDTICRRIAEVVGKVSIGGQPPEPVEPPIEPPPTETEENRVDVVSKVEGDVTIYVNGTLVQGHVNCEHVVKFEVTLTGDVKLVINGEDFNNEEELPAIPDNHCGIEATVFGGSDDPNNSAYPPFTLLDGDNENFVALPFSFPNNMFPGNAPRVRVFNGEVSAVGRVADKGPWTVDDTQYVNGTARPVAETCYLEKKPLPSGPNKGKIPTNKAGIDLSPRLAQQVGIKGKGTVDWMFTDEDENVVS